MPHKHVWGANTCGDRNDDDKDDRRMSKKPRGDPPLSSLEGEKIPLWLVLLQLYFNGHFGYPPSVFTGASKTSGASKRPLRPAHELSAKVVNSGPKAGRSVSVLSWHVWCASRPSHRRRMSLGRVPVSGCFSSKLSPVTW